MSTSQDFPLQVLTKTNCYPPNKVFCLYKQVQTCCNCLYTFKNGDLPDLEQTLNHRGLATEGCLNFNLHA